MTLECNANASPGNNQTIETQTLLMYLWPWPANPLTLKHNTHIYERRRFGVISFSRFILSWEQTGKTKAVMRCPSWWWLPKRSACIESAAVAGSNYGQYHMSHVRYRLMYVSISIWIEQCDECNWLVSPGATLYSAVFYEWRGSLVVVCTSRAPQWTTAIPQFS